MSITIQEARSIIRKAKRRVPEGEAITHLNITPMMDMMTILLVFMIKSMASATSALNIGEVLLPTSTTRVPPPEEAVSVIIAKNAIVVEGEPIVKVVNGEVDAAEKTDGKYGLEIARLKERLDKWHVGERKKAQLQGREASSELTIIADKDTPYRLLTYVMVSGANADFQQFRMIVLRNEE